MTALEYLKLFIDLMQKFFIALIEMPFYCKTSDSCWYGINVEIVLFELFGVCCFLFFFVITGLSTYLKWHPDRKNRLVELTYGANSHWMDKTVGTFDFIYGGFGVFSGVIFAYQFRKRFGWSLPDSYPCSALKEDDNYLKVLKEFPIFMRFLRLAYRLVFTGLICLFASGCFKL